MKKLLYSLVLPLVLAVTAPASAQSTWHVDGDCTPPGEGTEVRPFCTIQDGVDASFDGDIVLVAPGTYTGDGNRDISLFGKTIILKSSDGPDATTIDSEAGPGNIHRGFFLVHGETPETVIDGFTITGGYLIGVTDGVGEGGGGGAIYIRDSSPTICNCIIRDNISATQNPPFPVDGRGGGIYIDGNSGALIENCIIAENRGDRRGGGMYIGYASSMVTIRNCIVAGNNNGPNYPGAGVYLTFGTTIISNTMIVYNISGGPGGGMHNEGSDPVLANCLLWGNEAGPLFDGPQMSIGGFSSVVIAYSTVQDGLAGIANFGQLDWGPGMIDADPLFIDPETGDFRFLHGSPCIDAGNNLAVPEGVVTDLDGGPRFLDDPSTRDTGNPDPDAPKLPIVDMGPYEFDHLDCNNNDTPDDEDLADGTSQDCNGNTIPDECEVDCNDNDQPDDCDINDGFSEDCNGNLMPDECEGDCNKNGHPDDCDITEGTSEDCTANGIPDECEVDCNVNGQADTCDIAEGTSEDCTANGIPDECEPDCNDNGMADSCDIAQGMSMDCNENGVPDECAGEPTGPPITQQPVSQQVEVGGFAFFQVQADGVLLEYQWRKDGVDLIDSERILGTQTSTLVILDTQPSDAGDYDCVVTDLVDSGCSTSDPATLSVTDPCPADVNDDGVVGPVDLAMLLAAWGPCPDPDACPADLNADATVDPFDLAQLLAAWGPCS